MSQVEVRTEEHTVPESVYLVATDAVVITSQEVGPLCPPRVLLLALPCRFRVSTHLVILVSLYNSLGVFFFFFK